jgi:hypothetical protein
VRGTPWPRQQLVRDWQTDEMKVFWKLWTCVGFWVKRCVALGSRASEQLDRRDTCAAAHRRKCLAFPISRNGVKSLSFVAARSTILTRAKPFPARSSSYLPNITALPALLLYPSSACSSVSLFCFCFLMTTHLPYLEPWLGLPFSPSFFSSSSPYVNRLHC